MSRSTLAGLRRLTERLEHHRNRQRELIVQAHNDGASLRAIADACGLSHVTVGNIVRRATILAEIETRTS